MEFAAARAARWETDGVCMELLVVGMKFPAPAQHGSESQTIMILNEVILLYRVSRFFDSEHPISPPNYRIFHSVDMMPKSTHMAGIRILREDVVPAVAAEVASGNGRQGGLGDFIGTRD